jgi:hypothetical protein
MFRLQASIPALGYSLSHDRVEASDDYLQSIKSFAVTSEKKSLRRFLGKLAMVHHITPRLAGMKDKLFAALNRDKTRSTINFSRLELDTIDSIKKEVTMATALSRLQPGNPVTIHVDSNDTGMAATVSQSGRIIGQYCKAYDAKILQDQSSPIRESWGIAHTLRHYSDELYGQDVTIVTDHHNVLTMSRQDRQANPWLTRVWTMIHDAPVKPKFEWVPREDPNIQRVDRLSRGIPNKPLYCFPRYP